MQNLGLDFPKKAFEDSETQQSIENTNRSKTTDECPFLEKLIPEIRITIYEELLLYDEKTPGKTLSPQILATCNFVNREAQVILDSKNLKTTMLARITLSSEHELSIRHGAEAPRSIPKAEGMRHEVEIFQAPPADFKRAVIELNVELPATSHSDIHFSKYRPTARFQLYLLIAKIQASEIKKVRFRIRLYGEATPTDDTGEHLQFLTLPIRQLGSDIDLDLQGFDDDIEHQLREPIKFKILGDAPRKIALWHWLQVWNATRDFNEFLKKARVYEGSGMKVFFKSLCGNQPGPAGMTLLGLLEAEYIETEENLIRAAGKALREVSTGKRQQYLRKKAEDKLAQRAKSEEAAT